jgi:hypothetical protein
MEGQEFKIDLGEWVGLGTRRDGSKLKYLLPSVD